MEVVQNEFGVFFFLERSNQNSHTTSLGRLAGLEPATHGLIIEVTLSSHLVRGSKFDKVLYVALTTELQPPCF